MLKILRLRNDMKVGTLYCHTSSDHLVPMSSSRIGPKLTSKDESYIDIQSISLFDLSIRLVLVGRMVFFS